MFIRIEESENTRNTLTTLFWFRYETFIYLFEFKVFRHDERETQFLTMLSVRTSSALNSLTQPTIRHPADPNWSGLTQIKNRLPSSCVEYRLTAFFQIPKSLPGRMSFTSPVLFPLGFLLWHLWLSHPPSARVNTCTQCVDLTNLCTKQKVLSLTKPKGKIYKTKNDNIKKSLRYYITKSPKKYFLTNRTCISP